MSAAAVARDRRSCGDCAVSRSRSCCMRPSRRPLRFRSCSSRARQPPSLCCAIVPMLAAGACRCLRIMICSAVVLSAQPSSPIVPLFILRRSIMPCSHKQRRTCSAVAFASSVFGMSQLVLHEKNGLLEIFLSMCESSAPASSCRHARRQQAGYRSIGEILVGPPKVTHLL